MASKSSEVSVSEAKTRLYELLRQAEAGRSFIIRRRGRAVAQLIPPAKPFTVEDFTLIVNSFRAIRERVRGRVKIHDLIDSGRRA